MLVGTAGADCIVGYGGNDHLSGLGGEDLLIGGPGDDILDGGDDHDTIYGEEGNDHLIGGTWWDYLAGGDGNDHIEGGDGDDKIYGDAGDDWIEGGLGENDVLGGIGCDVLDGSAGYDVLRGGDGNDVIHGGLNPPWIEGGDGDDVIWSGSASYWAVTGGAGTDSCNGDECEVAAPIECTTSGDCAAGHACHPEVGLCVPSGHCSLGSGCTTNGECDDSETCTTDTCTAGACSNVAVTDGTSCPNDDICDGAETCSSGLCASGTPPVVDDEDHCTTDSCDPVTGVAHTPVEPDLIPDSTCDGIDDDCDGNIDEDHVPSSTSCGVGACGATGATSCVSGEVVDSCSPGTPAASDPTCDGVDDDCDGNIDEDYVPSSTSCGVGACGATGATSCVSGAVIDSCSPGTPGASDATCDGVDDDCSGVADEDYVSSSTSCGVGACGASGATSCVSGAVVDSCAPGTPAASDSTCDGIDDDCSGVADEDYVSSSTSCGVGACGATGATSCVSGAVVDSCSPGTPAASDATCDGIDDDCSGIADEDYVSSSTSCGVGACGATGATSCVSGAVVDSCAPGTPAASDATCDGIDDDCSGTADEDYVSSSTSCGVGACGATGATSCESGAVVDSCAPGAPAASDATCNGIDDDCSGVADEDYVPSATSCGVGACGATGATSCVSGAVVDSCSPGTPAASDATCDGIDDDCSGVVDDDFVAYCDGTQAVACVAGAPDLTECDDGDACNGGETCDAATCVAGTPPALDDGNACTADSCDPVTGPTHDPLPSGTPCADGDVCNGDETCDGAGACAPGVPPSLDDGNACTDDSCDPITGAAHEPSPVGTSCADGDVCNGDETCDGAGTCLAGMRPATGPCVPAGPTAAIFVDESRLLHDPGAGASVISYTGTSAPTISPHYVTWNPNGTATVATVVLDLASDIPVVVDRMVLHGYGFDSEVRHFEVWASETGTAPADFVRVLAAEHPQSSPNAVSYDLASTTARFIELRIVDDWLGNVGRGVVSRLTLHTRPRDGGAISLYEAGVSVAATSEASTAQYATDIHATHWWTSGPADTAPALTIDLPGEDWHVVDRVAIRSHPSNSFALRAFEIWISSTGTAESDFVHVFSGSVANTDPRRDAWFFFPPTPARHVRLRAIDNVSGGTRVAVDGFRVHTPHAGGLTVPFDDRSVAGELPIIWWDWDFGDGERSVLRNPTHTFAGAGSYLVSLAVTDEYGVRSRAEYLYEAHDGPSAFFTWTPDPVRQGNSVQLRDRSVSDSPLVAIDWNVDGTASSTPAAGSAYYTASQVRPFVVSATAVDSSLLRDTYAVEIPLENIAPVLDIGSDQTLVWGQEWTPASPATVTDASSGDWFSLRCEWDFDDGATGVSPLPCRPDTFYVGHSWSAPGTYEVVATAIDPSSGRTEDRFFVEVTRRATEIGLDTIPGVESGGTHEVVARLMDAYEPSASMAGRTIELRLGSQVVTAIADATGAARASLDFVASSTSLVEASFAGDSLYFASSHSGLYPEELPPARRASCGRDFWLAIPHLNHEGQIERNSLFFTAARDTTATVEVGTWSASARVAARGTARVDLPSSAEVTASGLITSQGIHVQSSREICATVMMYQRYSTDSYLGLAVAGLGRSYVVSSFTGTPGAPIGRSGTVVIATEDGTEVTIVPSTEIEMGPSLPSTVAGVPFVVTMNRGQTLQLRATGTAPNDLTGTRIDATAAIAVIGGHSCAYVPQDRVACDTLAEQLPPAEALGSHFLVAPLAGRASGYLVRVVAASDATEVRVDGSLVATIDRGQHHQVSVSTQSPLLIETTQPALVSQYARGGSTDGVGDPFQMTIVPSDQLARDLVFTTVPDYAPAPGVAIDFQHRVTLIAQAGTTGGVRLDGAAVTAAFQSIGTSGWAYAHVTVESGEHTAQHLSPGALVGVYAYGWSQYESYGHPGFMRLEPHGTCVPAATVAGNGADDDCDGEIDEEDPNGLDDDGDGLIDEDLHLTEGTAPNVGPVAYESRVGTREDTAVSFVVAAFDSNGDPLTYELVTSPSNGAVTGTLPSITYTPAVDFNGADSFTFRACDASACSAPATVTVSVAATNDPPDIQMEPLVTGLEDSLLTLRCVAEDIDLDPECALSWSLVSAPHGMTIDAVTGDIYWVADESYMAETVSATVRVTDCHGASSIFAFEVAIASRPDAPRITTSPVRTARFGMQYVYDVDAFDPDPGDSVTFELLQGPTTMSIVASTGVILWSPTSSDVGPHTVRVVAIDSTTLRSPVQEFEVVAAGDDQPPLVDVSVTPSIVLPGETSTITVVVSDDDDVAIESVTVGGTPITMTSGTGTFSSTTPGVYEVVATAVDPTGNRTVDRDAVRVRVIGDDTAPVVDLTAPAADTELTYLHDAIGSVHDDNLHRYTLDLRLAGRTAWRTIASGRANVTSAVLGTIDTTQLENGTYLLRLRAEDVNGQVGDDVVPFRVAGGAKVGLVQLSFTDMVVSDFGIPLAAVRRYDSRLQGRDDFGRGWDLELRHGSVQHNRTVGEGIAIFTRADDLTPCQHTEEQLPHFTEVRISESEWYLFRPTIVNTQPLAGGCGGTVVFEQVDGVRGGAELVAFGHTEVRATAISPITAGSFVSESNLTNTITGDLYNPEAFRLTLADGRVLDLSVRGGITRIEDRHGNWVAFTDTGLVHSSGRSLRFVRDAHRRITQILDSAGRSTGYEYDARGNLVVSIDVLGRRTRYEYRESAYPHHLTHIIDHRDVVTAALEYHDDGRLDRLCDADGQCTRTSYDLTAQSMVITDGLGRPTQYAYNNRGNV
ncbi:MAG: MopE-related protein [Actinomycetota bacterium]|nr:MopE-related protein [Actinomycetota bacterium]